MALGSVKWGTLNLNDYTNYTVLPSGLSLPKLQPSLNTMPFATNEGSNLAFERYGEVSATIRGWFSPSGDTEVAVQASRDTLAAALQGENDLRLGFVDERYWRARFNGVQFDYINPLGLEYQANFQCLKPFAYANAAETNVVNNSALSVVAGTLYKKSINVPTAGNMYTWPSFTIAVPAGGPYGMTEIWIFNVTTGQSMIIARTFAASQSYTFDMDAQTYFWTNASPLPVPVNYTGQRVYLTPATTPNVIEIYARATSTPTLNVTIAYRSRFR